ncbi:MAG: tetratricopeptide repeat protein [Lachnospiraceae bacterium]|nr:tetratricopeptide repeat protein [Lachnospiraceae bacterium]
MFWELVGNLGSIVTIVSKIEEIVRGKSDEQIIRKLKHLYADVDFTALPNDLARYLDKADSYIALKKSEIVGTELFSQNEKNAFIENFFSSHPETLPYKDYIDAILLKFLEQLEKLLLQKMSIGEQVIYKKIEQLSEKSDTTNFGKQNNANSDMNEKVVADSYKDLPRILTNTAVPYEDDLNIIHRKTDINKMEQLLKRKKCNIIISGFGGIGKTTLAHILYFRMIDQYDSIGWVEYRGNFKKSLLTSISLYDDVSDTESRWRILYSQLRNDRSRKLIFIDNVDRDATLEQDPLTDTLLQDISGWPNTNVVITSRLEDIAGYYTFPLNYLSFEDCIDLFYLYYSRDEYNILAENRCQYKTVQDIVKLAERHTYTIELLAKVAKNYESLEHFWDAVNKTKFKLTKWPIRTNYRNIYANIAEQLRKLFDMGTRTSREKQILWDFSVLPNMELTCDEVYDWLGYDENDLIHLINEGWLTHKQTISLHPLIKEVIRLDYVDGKAPIGTVSKLVSLVNSSTFIKNDDPFTEANRKLDAIESISSLIFIPKKQDYACFNYNIGNCLQYRGRITSSISHYRKSLSMYQSLLDENSDEYEAETARVHNSLGYLLSYTNSGRREAEIQLREALRILCDLEAKNSKKYLEEDKATTCDYLGYLLTDTNYHRGEAESLLREALKIRCKLDADHSGAYKAQVAWTRDNLGYLLSFSNSRLKEAEYQLKMALKTRLQLEDENPGVYLAEVTWTYNNLGVLLQTENNRQKEAEELYQKALLMRYQDEEEKPGMNLPDIAILCNNLGTLYQRNNIYRAEDMYRNALKINYYLEEKCPEMYLSEIAIVCNNLATLIQGDRNRCDEAKNLYKDALQIVCKLEKDCPSIFQMDAADISFNVALLALKVDQDILIVKELLQDALSIWAKNSEYEGSIKIAHKILDELSRKDIFSSYSDFFQTVENLKIVYTQSGLRKKRMHFCIPAKFSSYD